MLRSFEISNFRLFKHLELRNLGRLNLVVGQNNSGKSALLEAVSVYASNAAPRTLMNLITAREETWYGKAQVEFQHEFGNPVRHLFYGHRLPEVDDPGIILGPGNEPEERLRITVAAFMAVPTDEGIRQLRRLERSELQRADQDVEFALVAQQGERPRIVIFFNREHPYDDLRSRARSFSETPRFPIQVVPTRSMTANDVAGLWDATGLTDLAPEVYSGLNLIHRSRVVGIQFVESTIAPRERVALARTEGVPEPLPLRSMGDGTTRLFQILLALVNAKDGILLLDEFENGLHWSVQSEVWTTIFRLAIRLNVQVFASTHSSDCIRGFGDAWKQNKNAGAFFRLDVGSDGVARARPYSLETLGDSLETVVEVR